MPYLHVNGTVTKGRMIKAKRLDVYCHQCVVNRYHKSQIFILSFN